MIIKSMSHHRMYLFYNKFLFITEKLHVLLWSFIGGIQKIMFFMFLSMVVGKLRSGRIKKLQMENACYTFMAEKDLISRTKPDKTQK
jgi:hypothetical protein